MTKGSLTAQQQAKLAEALELAKLAEEKARQMSELATEVANKYQQHLYDLVNSASKQAS
jgi:hypothetical protein